MPYHGDPTADEDRVPTSEGPALTCCLLTVLDSSWFVQLVRIAPGLATCTVDARRLGLPWIPNPCGLESGEAFDAVLVTADWYQWVACRYPGRVASTFERLRGLAEAIVLLDHHDQFALGVPAEAIEHASIVLKAQGVYRDRELYNYRVGPFFPGGNWTNKLERRRVLYSASHLDKIRLSVPCFLAVDLPTRRAMRRLSDRGHGKTLLRDAGDLLLASLTHAKRARHRAVSSHFVGSLTHWQRLELVERLEAAGRGGQHGVTNVPELFYGVHGFETDGARLGVGGAGWLEEHDIWICPREEDPPGASGPVAMLPSGSTVRVAQDVVNAAQTRLGASGAQVRAAGRIPYVWSLARSDLVLAPAGFGELTFRHGEALIFGRTLICQDLSHVETMFPFAHMRNAIFIRPDLADLEALLGAIDRGEIAAERIACEGRRTWRDWSGRRSSLLRDGITKHVEEAVGKRSAALSGLR
jgi:hypothetical protein